jgi:hypothetical protein
MRPAANVRIAQKAETGPLVTPSTGYLERHAHRLGASADYNNDSAVSRKPVVGVKAFHPNLGLRQPLEQFIQRPETDAFLWRHEQADAEGVLDDDAGLV